VRGVDWPRQGACPGIKRADRIIRGSGATGGATGAVRFHKVRPLRRLRTLSAAFGTQRQALLTIDIGVSYDRQQDLLHHRLHLGTNRVEETRQMIGRCSSISTLVTSHFSAPQQNPVGSLPEIRRRTTNSRVRPSLRRRIKLGARPVRNVHTQFAAVNPQSQRN